MLAYKYKAKTRVAHLKRQWLPLAIYTVTETLLNLKVTKYMVMWWMLWMLARFIHQVAIVDCIDAAHWSSPQLMSDLRPSTALLASYLPLPERYGYCLYAGLLTAKLTVNKHTPDTYIKHKIPSDIESIILTFW